jgi:hypothetical protein
MKNEKYQEYIEKKVEDRNKEIRKVLRELAKTGQVITAEEFKRRIGIK